MRAAVRDRQLEEDVADAVLEQPSVGLAGSHPEVPDQATDVPVLGLAINPSLGDCAYCACGRRLTRHRVRQGDEFPLPASESIDPIKRDERVVKVRVHPASTPSRARRPRA